MAIRYPAGPVTPHGWWHIVKGIHPMMWLTAYDESVTIDLMGGLAIPDRYAAPECVQIPRDGLKGLIPPWKHIQQKGATQDGVTHIDALYDPTEVQLTAICRGRDAKHTRQVYRHLIDSIDAIQQSQLHFFTQDVGHWWADIRWFQGAPPEPLRGAQENRQKIPLRLQADNAFWRTYDHADVFQCSYDAMVEGFDVDHTGTQDLGTVPQSYTGTGGYCTSTGGQMVWVGAGRRVINGPWPGFATDTDNQVITQEHGSQQGPGSSNIVGGRLGVDGSGVFVEYDSQTLRLFYIVGGVETTLREEPIWLPPWTSEKFSLVCGYAGDPRMFKVLRNGLPVMVVKESGAGSPLGVANRGVGNGLSGDAPATIRTLLAGDNTETSQSGFLKRINIGDQKMYDDYTLFGPFTKVKIYDGPGSDEYVEFGPLLANQIVFLRTDPRSNTTLVQDLTVAPTVPQQLPTFNEAWSKYLSFAGTGGSLQDLVQSLFGVQTPQGNLYKFLKGRFSDSAAIPAKSPGNPVEPYYVKVEIEGGNADSKILASGTPLRRYPL